RLGARLDGIVDEQREVVERWREGVLEARHPNVAAPWSVLETLAAEAVPRVLDGAPDASPRVRAQSIERIFGVHVSPSVVADPTAVPRQVALGLTALREWLFDLVDAFVDEVEALPDAEEGASARLELLGAVLPAQLAGAPEPRRALRFATRRRFRRDTPRRTLRAFRAIHLAALDASWRAQLETLLAMRRGLSLRAFERGDPVLSFRADAFDAFEQMRRDVRHRTLCAFFAEARFDRARVEVLEGRPGASRA
ncbi:MAG: hypothetical protein AAGH15_09365, partial [Myxococcota bacterium]